VAALTNQLDLHAILFGELSNLLDELCLLRHNSSLVPLDRSSSVDLTTCAPMARGMSRRATPTSYSRDLLLVLAPLHSTDQTDPTVRNSGTVKRESSSLPVTGASYT
jgi:hypothetical protein